MTDTSLAGQSVRRFPANTTYLINKDVWVIFHLGKQRGYTAVVIGNAVDRVFGKAQLHEFYIDRACVNRFIVFCKNLFSGSYLDPWYGTQSCYIMVHDGGEWVFEVLVQLIDLVFS